MLAWMKRDCATIILSEGQGKACKCRYALENDGLDVKCPTVFSNE